MIITTLLLSSLAVWMQLDPAIQPHVYASRDKIEVAAQTCGLLPSSLEYGHDEMGDFADPVRFPTSPPSPEALNCMTQWAITNTARFGMFLEPSKRSVGSGTTADISLLADAAHSCGMRVYKDPLDRETMLLLNRRYESPTKLDCLKGWIATHHLASVSYQLLD